MYKRRVVILFVSLAVAAGARAASPSAAPAAGRTSSPASASAPVAPPARPGRWYYYSAYEAAKLMAATGDHLWFGPRGLFRYDLKTGKAEAVTPMQGAQVDLSNMGCVSPSSDGRFAFPNGWSDILVWSAAKGLQPVAPHPQEGWFEWIGFDAKDRLLQGKRLQPGQRGQWFVYHPDTAGWGIVDVPGPDDLRPAIDRQAAIKVTTTAPNMRYAIHTITLEDGKALPPLRTARYSQDKPYRDANGHIWFGTWRFDGSAWKRVAPPEFFPFENPNDTSFYTAHAAALDPGRCELDERTMTWRASNPAGDTDIYAYDAAGRTGFRQVEKDGKWLLQQVRHTPDGWTVMREVDVTEYSGMPQARDRNGNWWWNANNKMGHSFVLRLGEKGLKVYEPKLAQAGTGPRQFVVSPAGRLWLWDMAYWQRYDAEKDALIPPSNAAPAVEDKDGRHLVKMPEFQPSDWPLDEFAFTFGQWTLARMGHCGPMAGRVFVKKDNRWEPFLLPGADMTDYGGRGCLTGTRHMIHGRRMLVHWEGKDSGIYEYDQDSRRWDYLLRGSYNEAGYDAAGRVIILTQYALLVYDRGKAPAAEPGLDKGQASLFARLVQQLDDNSYAQREEATNKLIAMGRGILPRLREQMDAPGNSPEVQARLALVLDKLAPKPPPGARPIPLLRQMHPCLTTRPAGQ